MTHQLMSKALILPAYSISNFLQRLRFLKDIIILFSFLLFVAELNRAWLLRAGWEPDQVSRPPPQRLGHGAEGVHFGCFSGEEAKG